MFQRNLLKASVEKVLFSGTRKDGTAVMNEPIKARRV
jgi:hypothetical protein